jgi:hypothetical protein
MSAGLFDLAVDRVRIQLIRPPAESVLDTVVFFPVDANQLTVQLKVPLVSRREILLASLELRSGSTLLFAGADSIEVTETTSVAPPVDLAYVGPGADLTGVRIAPRDTALKPGDAFTFDVTATSGVNPVPRFYVGWSTSDPTLASVNAVGTLVAPNQRGHVMLRVVAPTGIKDSTNIWFSPSASAMTIASGNQQTWFAGLRLPELLTVRVVAPDGLGVPGVRVSFVPITGGQASDTVSISDQDGYARTAATLGRVAGSHAFEARAPRLATLTFSATARAGPPAILEALGGQGQTDTVGQPLPASLIAQVTDFVGNPIPNVAIAWQVIAGGGSLDHVTGVTNLSGLAFADFTLGPFPGRHVVRTSTVSPPLAVDFSATAVPGAPASIAVFTGDGQTGGAGTILAPMTAIVRDQFGTLLAGIAVRWGEVHGGGLLTPTLTTTDDLGRATTVYRLPGVSGPANVTAEVEGTGLSVTFVATVVP